MPSLKSEPDIDRRFVLAADTVVAVGRRILPKAETLDEAAILPAAAVGPLAPGLFRHLR